MGKGGCGLHGLSTKKSAMINVKARQPDNFMSNLIQHTFWPIGHDIIHMAAHNMWSRDYDNDNDNIVYLTKNNNTHKRYIIFWINKL